MNNVADITDTWGSFIRVDVVPGDDYSPQRVSIIIKDETTAAVVLTRGQVAALINALTDAIGGDD